MFPLNDVSFVNLTPIFYFYTALILQTHITPQEYIVSCVVLQLTSILYKLGMVWIVYDSAGYVRAVYLSSG
jgi:hypothetical protein